MNKKIAVIVEDEPDTADMLAEMMKLMGFQVFISPGGLRAVDLIDEKRPAAVLLDQMMPEISGLQILQLVRSNPRLSQIPVIMRKDSTPARPIAQRSRFCFRVSSQSERCR